MLVLSFLMVSLYDMNEREVRSMALNDNIKKIREEKDILQCAKDMREAAKNPLVPGARIIRGADAVPVYVNCMPMGERFKMSRSNYSKKVSNGAWSHFG